MLKVGTHTHTLTHTHTHTHTHNSFQFEKKLGGGRVCRWQERWRCVWHTAEGGGGCRPSKYMPTYPKVPPCKWPFISKRAGEERRAPKVGPGGPLDVCSFVEKLHVIGEPKRGESSHLVGLRVERRQFKLVLLVNIYYVGDLLLDCKKPRDVMEYTLCYPVKYLPSNNSSSPTVLGVEEILFSPLSRSQVKCKVGEVLQPCGQGPKLTKREYPIYINILRRNDIHIYALYPSYAYLFGRIIK